MDMSGPRLASSAFWLLISLSIILSVSSAPAAVADPRISRTLRPGASLTVGASRCALSIPVRSPSRVVLRCLTPERTSQQVRPPGIRYLGLGQTVTFRAARGCALGIRKLGKTNRIKVSCVRPKRSAVTPTATASPTPIASASPTPTATASPTPTATASSTSTPTASPTATSTVLPTLTATPSPTASPTTVPTRSVGGSTSGLVGQVTLQNNGGDTLTVSANGSFTFSIPLAEGATYNVSILTQPATQTCTVSNGSGTVGSSNVTNVSVSCSTNTTTLSTSVSTLALSVTGLTQFGVNGTPSSGLARVVTVTNTGALTATNLSVILPTLPSGSSSSTTCGSTLTPSASCTITITPGATATSDGTNPCTGLTAPVPGEITVSADNATTTTVGVVVLGYGCIYQGGYVFALDDTTPNTSSVGGKVAAISDQAPAFPNGVVWGSNGGSSVNVSFDLIPGISETSTTVSGSPSYTDFSAWFSTTYTNLNPFTSASFASCAGSFDGSCNTANIVTFYSQFITNFTGGGGPFTASAGPTSLSFYAAGLCSQTIAGLTDWYLPAICEMGYGSGTAPCGTMGSPGSQNIQGNLVGSLGLNLTGSFWSSTEFSFAPTTNAHVQVFDVGSGSAQGVVNKSNLLGVRCVRSLIP
jgi:hypothetical protein